MSLQFHPSFFGDFAKLTRQITPSTASMLKGAGLIAVPTAGAQLLQPIIGGFQQRQNIKLQAKNYKKLLTKARAALMAGIGAAGVGMAVNRLLESRLRLQTERRLFEQQMEGAMDFIDPDDVADVRFQDVVGLEKAKAKLRGLIKRLENPEQYKAHMKPGESFNLSLLMDSAPGGGKTYLAKAFMGELLAKGIDAEFIEFHPEKLSSGELGARTLKHLTEQIETSPADTVVVYMDEMESFASRNKPGISERKVDNINAFLKMMDGFRNVPDKNVVWLASTNRYNDLDPAIKSRMGERITIAEPNASERRLLISKLIKEKDLPPPPDFNINEVLKETDGLSNRDIKNAFVLLKERLLDDLKPGQSSLQFTLKQLKDAIADTRAKVQEDAPPPPYEHPPAYESPPSYQQATQTRLNPNNTQGKGSPPAYETLPPFTLPPGLEQNTPRRHNPFE